MAITYFPFVNEPFKAQMGLKLLESKDWLELDEKRMAQVALKAQLLRDHREEVLCVQDEERARPAALELYEILWAHLQEFYSEELFAPKAAPSGVRDVFVEIAKLVQEDFCLLSPLDYTLMAGLVCFPSRWKLPDKIGKNSDGIHQPVDHFKSIARPTAGALSQLSKPLVRFNWTIHDKDELFAPEARHTPMRFQPSEVLQNTFLRLERQTLRRLPESRAIAFSIRTYIHRMDEVIADEERRKTMRTTLETLPQPVAEYKGMKYFFDELKKAVSGS